MIPSQIARLQARGRLLASRAMGRPMTIRLSHPTAARAGSTVSGTVEQVEFAGVRHRGRSIVLQFRVRLRGPNGQLAEPHVVEELPQ